MKTLVQACFFLVITACKDEVTDASQCLPTWGDSCGCTPQCLTQDELDAVTKGGVCDLDCDGGDGPNWTCAVADGRCAVAD